MMLKGERVNHLQTIIGIVVCAIGVTLATPILRIVVIVFGIISGFAGFADWLPDAVEFYLIVSPIDVIVTAATGFLALIVTRLFIPRANASIVAYVVGTIYLFIFLGLIAIIYSHGQTPDDLLRQSVQLTGIILGLALGRAHVFPSRG
jgi:hypothetical protein